jgi:hypothetical protein
MLGLLIACILILFHLKQSKHPKQLGGQPVLCDEEEKVLAENIATFADWGISLGY